jgi:hypothetical protein
MNRNQNIAVITIGYKHYALEDAQAALELMALMSKAVQVEEREYGMSDYTPCTHFLSEDPELPQLKFVSARKFNPQETVAEVKERGEREKKDREDLEQQMREAPAALPAPSATSTDDVVDAEFI